MASEALLLGRVTYEGFAAAWPSREGDFADKFNGMAKYVVSDDAPAIRSGTTPPSSPRTYRRGVRELKEREGRRHSRRTAAPRWSKTLADHDLVDEYRLMVFPTVVRRGQAAVPRGCHR